MPDHALEPPTVHVVGIHGGECFGTAAADALSRADAVIGSSRHLDELRYPIGGRLVPTTSIGDLVDEVDARCSAGQAVCVVASGDPGFFGIGRILTGRRGRSSVTLHPAPSSVAIAFARAGLHWDDAAVVSAHGRPLADSIAALGRYAKAAVLTAPGAPPEAIGKALLANDPADERDVWVCTRLGHCDETVTHIDLHGLASGTFDPMSVVVLAGPASGADGPATIAWGRPTNEFQHRAGMITKPEVRAAILSKLDLHGAATLWDVGAGSGSVGVEAARLMPGLRVHAIEQNAEDCARIRANSEDLPITVWEGRAPLCFDEMPAADRIFVGGGGMDALEAACRRIEPGGVVVAAFATLDRAAAAARLLGDLVQIAVSRAVPIGDGAIRLEAENPVFVASGRPR